MATPGMRGSSSNGTPGGEPIKYSASGAQPSAKTGAELTVAALAPRRASRCASLGAVDQIPVGTGPLKRHVRIPVFSRGLPLPRQALTQRAMPVEILRQQALFDPL